MVDEELSQSLQYTEIWKPICGDTTPALRAVDYFLQLVDVFYLRKAEDGGEKKADYLEKWVWTVVEAGEGKARWDAGSADVLEVVASDCLRIGAKAAAGIFG